MITFLTYTAAQPLLAAEWGLSSAQAGAIFAAQQAGYTLAVVLLSSLTDVVGVRRVYLLSAAWNAVARGSSPWAHAALPAPRCCGP